ncbi:MAG TPA: hypothetical protein VNZ61_14765 [Roseomonas sp.]|nr:hypothetical protein [Roseomonas sp.]
MPRFQVNVPVTQADPVVQVEIDPASPLPLGVNRFQLIVVDDAGNESAPFVIEVMVKDTERPTAQLDVVDANGAIVDPVVSFGQPFILSGKRSSDAGGGSIKEYRFTLLNHV